MEMRFNPLIFTTWLMEQCDLLCFQKEKRHPKVQALWERHQEHLSSSSHWASGPQFSACRKKKSILCFKINRSSSNTYSIQERLRFPSELTGPLVMNLPLLIKAEMGGALLLSPAASYKYLWKLSSKALGDPISGMGWSSNPRHGQMQYEVMEVSIQVAWDLY